MKSRILLQSLICCAVLAVVLTSCNMPTSQRTPTSSALPHTPAASRTPAVLPTSTGTPIPTLTVLPSLSPTPALIIPAGYEPVIHPDLPNYVFVIEPQKWELALSSEDAYAFLKHRTIQGCALRLVPPMGLPLPLRYYPKTIAARKWWVDEYAASAFYHDDSIFLDLRGYKDSKDCLADQELVLARIMTAGEAHGEPTPAFTPTPTSRPPLEGFSCPGTPPSRLRVDDHVLILAEGIFLRSEPRAVEETKIEQYLKDTPYDIVITGGPACDAYVYWKVSMSQLAEGGKVVSGWLAEGDLKNYYLEPYDVPNFGN